MAFEGFTHLPVDFAQALDAFVECSVYAGLTPFVYYFHVNHTEGPKKWYIGTCRGEVVKVYLPARALLYRWGIREDGSPGTFNGDKVIINADVRFEVGSDVTVGFGHLALLDEIRATVENSPNSEVIFEAGTHIGYMYTPDQDFESLDFVVSDQSVDSGLTEDPNDWWNVRVNPLDYFTEENRQLILDAYQGTYNMLVAQGTTPYSDMEDSRLNINKQDQIWGIWFKDDLDHAFGVDQGTAWAVISFLDKADFNQETYWRTLQEFPTMSGLFVEKGRTTEVVGNPLYEGQPIGANKFYMFSGTAASGVGTLRGGLRACASRVLLEIRCSAEHR